MEVRGVLSEWWSIALVSLAVGGLTFLALFVFQEYPSSLFIWISSLSYSFWAIIATCALMTAVPWRPLSLETMDPVKLRQAGYDVTIRGNEFDLRVAKYSIVRLRMVDGRLWYRCLPTSTGFWAVFLLSTTFLAIIAFPFLLQTYVQCQKGLGALAPGLKGLSRPSEKGPDELVKDSITAAYMLAKETSDANRSRYQDHCIILVTMALVGFAVLLMMSVQYPLDSDEFVWRLGGGTASLVAITIVGCLVLRGRSRMTIEKDEQWAKELMALMSGPVPEGGSAVEMLLRACPEVPRWLNAYRKGMWYRRPGMTLLIFLLLDQGVIFLTRGYVFDLVQLLGGVLFTLGVFLLIDQYRRGRKESDELNENWHGKIMELENVLGLTEER